MTDAVSRFCRNPRISETRTDDEVFLVNADTDGIYHLNPVGAGVWHALSSPLSGGELVALLAVAFPDIAEARLRDDVAALLDEMRAHLLIEEVRDGPPESSG